MKALCVLALALLAAMTARPACAAYTIKIGVIYPLTGNAASAGSSAKDAVELGADIVNTAHPELQGLPLAAAAGLPVSRLDSLFLALIALTNLFFGGVALAQEVKVVSSGGFAAAYRALAPEFELKTGYKLSAAWGPSMGKTADAVPSRLARGEAIDVVIMVGYALGDLVADELGHLAGIRHVDLVEHHRARALDKVDQDRIPLQRRRVGGQLGFQRVDVGDRVAARFRSGAVDDVHEHGTPLDVAQEVQTQAAAL